MLEPLYEIKTHFLSAFIIINRWRKFVCSLICGKNNLPIVSYFKNGAALWKNVCSLYMLSDFIKWLSFFCSSRHFFYWKSYFYKQCVLVVATTMVVKNIVFQHHQCFDLLSDGHWTCSHYYIFSELNFEKSAI